MDKIVELIKEAEVRGVLAAFVDAGLVKVAGQEAFDKLAAAVCRKLGEEDYTLEKVAQVTEAVLQHPGNQAVGSGAPAGKNDIRMQLGELMLSKAAGSIDSAAFVKEASALLSGNASFAKTAVLAPALVPAVLGGARSSGLSDAQRATLQQEYGLQEDANIAARNAGRGVAGAVAGGLAGRAIGSRAAKLLGEPGIVRRFGQAASGVGAGLADVGKKGFALFSEAAYGGGSPVRAGRLVNRAGNVASSLGRLAGRTAGGLVYGLSGTRFGGALRGAGALAGGLFGAKQMTDKYSRASADRIMQRKSVDPMATALYQKYVQQGF